MITPPRIYHIMIDRFAGCRRPDRKRGFRGGQLNGITRRLDYIQSLGFTGILLTPFYQGTAYHGYHVTDYEAVDPHFGTKEDLRLLVDEVHRRGMTVAADFVPNHCHRSAKLYRQHPEWFHRKADGTPRGFADLDFLPMFNLDHPEARAYMIARGRDLCDLGFDSIRLDHATGPSRDFWKAFRAELRNYAPHVKLVAEVWGATDFVPEDEKRFATNEQLLSTQEARQLEYKDCFDGMMDFAYQELLCRAANRGEHILGNERLQAEVDAHFARYQAADGELFLFLDNHDLNRFLYECRCNKRLLREAIAFTLRQPHPFIFYYGTEIAMHHKHSIFDGTPYADERVRDVMNWGKAARAARPLG